MANAEDAAPDFMAPLEAWRAWRVVEHDGELSLASVVKRTLWPPRRPFVASCLRPRIPSDWLRRRRPHEAPAETCECGIYATRLELCGEYLTDSPPPAFARVIGRVAIWGTVVECELGFRASHAYPVALYIPEDASRRASPEEIASRLARYGISIELVPTDRKDVPALLRSAG
jgi:hypothetical protein